jgi:hypothetical protein
MTTNSSVSTVGNLWFNDELLAAAVDVVLDVEEGAALDVALGFQGLNLLLPGQLFHTI